MKPIKFTDEDFRQYREFFEEHIGGHARIHIGGVGKCVDVKVVSVNAPKQLLYYVPLRKSEEGVQAVPLKEIFGHESLRRTEYSGRENNVRFL